jgi:small-conductance mechanosensitive channel
MPNPEPQSLNYLLDQIDKLLIFLERSQVQIQLAAIATVLVISAGLYRRLWKHFQQKFPLPLMLWQQDRPIGLQEYSIILIRYLTLPILNLLGLFILLKTWQSHQFINGLIVVAWEIAILHTGYRLFLASLCLGFAPKIVRKYQLSFFLPIFILLVCIRIINIAGNFQDILSANVLNLFGSPLRVGAILISSVGLYLWFVGVGIFQYLLLSFLTANNRVETGTAEATVILIRYFLMAFGIVLIFGYIGFSPTAFAAITGGLSVGLGFGLKEVFSNFISGIFLLFEGVLRPGDLISIDGTTAEVKKLGIRATTVKISADNSEKIIPNQTFFTDIVTTFTGSDRIIRNSLTIGVSYDADPQKVIEILLGLAADNPHILEDPKPLAFLIDFADFSISYQLTFYLDDPTIGKTIKSDLSRQLWQRFAENGIEMPFPQYDIHLRSSNVPLAFPSPDSHPDSHADSEPRSQL